MRSRSFVPARRQRAGGAEPRRSPGATGSASANRLGATLTEVLMAILIMAVGVVSVFTLFPISVIRTIQATNQTNAKILKKNVEEHVAQSPELLFEFSASTVNPAPASPFAGRRMRGEWQAETNYVGGDVVIPTVKPGNTLPAPFEFYFVSVAGTSGLSEPIWSIVDDPANPTDQLTSDGTNLVWDRALFFRYVIDPLGLNTARSDDQSNAVVDTFGTRTDRTTGSATARGLPRIHAGRTHATDVRMAIALSADVCVHPDSWQELIQAVPTGLTADSVTFPPTVDLTGFYPDPSIPVVVFPRVVISSLDGTQTFVRELVNAPSGQTVSWSAEEPLPVRFVPGDVGTARIEVFNRRYAWFMTVRNVGARPEIKVIVTFNRAFTSAEEHAYATNFGNVNIDCNDNGNADSADGLTSTNQVMIAWEPGTTAGWDPEGSGTDHTLEPEPLLKAGNWLFDARDASWYRIQSIDVESPAAATPQWKIVSVDRTVRAETPDDNAGPPSAATPIGRSILLPGIVDVFDL